MEIISRKEAKEQGLTTYFTGVPCVRGHIEPRWAVDCSCIICRREINNKYGKNNPEKRKKIHDEWLSKEENQEKNKEYKRKWKLNNPIKVKAYWHRKRAAEGFYVEEDIIQLLHDQFECCTGCNREFSEKLKFTIDHIIPLSKGGTSWPSNIQLLCGSCNYSKGAKEMLEWLSLKGR